MPFVLIAFGLLFLVVAVQGTQGSLFTLLKSEFVGTNSFIPWVAAFIILGLIAYIKPVRPVAHAFMALLFLVLILTNGTGFFAKFNQALANPVAPAVDPSTGETTAAGGIYGVPNSITQSTTPVPGLTPSQQQGSAATLYRALTSPETYQ